MIERAKDAQVIGIVVGTLGVGKYGLLLKTESLDNAILAF